MSLLRLLEAREINMYVTPVSLPYYEMNYKSSSEEESDDDSDECCDCYCENFARHCPVDNDTSDMEFDSDSSDIPFSNWLSNRVNEDVRSIFNFGSEEESEEEELTNDNIPELLDLESDNYNIPKHPPNTKNIFTKGNESDNVPELLDFDSDSNDNTSIQDNSDKHTLGIDENIKDIQGDIIPHLIEIDSSDDNDNKDDNNSNSNMIIDKQPKNNNSSIKKSINEFEYDDINITSTDCDYNTIPGLLDIEEDSNENISDLSDNDDLLHTDIHNNNTKEDQNYKNIPGLLDIEKDSDDDIPDLLDISEEPDDNNTKQNIKFEESDKKLPELFNINDSNDSNNSGNKDILPDLVEINSCSNSEENSEDILSIISTDSEDNKLSTNKNDNSTDLPSDNELRNLLKKRKRTEMTKCDTEESQIPNIFSNFPEDSFIGTPYSLNNNNNNNNNNENIQLKCKKQDKYNNPYKYSKYSFSSCNFKSQIASNKYFITKLDYSDSICGHEGCVNSINWSLDGRYLVSGSDDLTVAIWDSLNDFDCSIRYNSPHTANIFCTKFLPNGNNQIISCGRDGVVAAYNIEVGSKFYDTEDIQTVAPIITCTCHDGPAKRLTVDIENPYLFQSCGIDGFVYLYDIRESHICNNSSHANILVSGENEGSFGIHSMASNPSIGNEFIIGGRSNKIHLFDRRKPLKSIGYYRGHSTQITGVAFSNNGKEILGSYTGSEICLFDKNEQLSNNFNTIKQRYSGHKNTDTVKGVNFFGPNSEYIISGSDCGNIFIWDKWTGKILTYLHGDDDVVNCVTGNPVNPLLLASSGIEDDIHIYLPSIHDNNLVDLQKIIKRNKATSNFSSEDFLQQLFMRRFMQQHDNLIDSDSDEEETQRCMIQ